MGIILYPPFLSNTTRAKEEKTPHSKGANKLEQFMETFFWGTWGCTDSEKLKVLLWGLLSHKGPFLEFYDKTNLLVGLTTWPSLCFFFFLFLFFYFFPSIFSFYSFFSFYFFFFLLSFLSILFFINDVSKVSFFLKIHIFTSKYTFLPQNSQNTHFCVWKIHIFTSKYTFFPWPIHIFGKCQNFEWQGCN